MCVFFSKAHHTPVNPVYQKHSRQMTPKKEADRLVRYAGQLLVSGPRCNCGSMEHGVRILIVDVAHCCVNKVSCYHAKT